MTVVMAEEILETTLKQVNYSSVCSSIIDYCNKDSAYHMYEQ